MDVQNMTGRPEETDFQNLPIVPEFTIQAKTILNDILLKKLKTYVDAFLFYALFDLFIKETYDVA